ncbi:MAG: NHLP bacteriocin export ABC transporter permease/ATPase subunit, partial [Symploca sp. SIO3E6]|nr:NHLP bacteriocin export ABC transporter permease/ATPase subunit [Caldora sp. SIO3E6]
MSSKKQALLSLASILNPEWDGFSPDTADPLLAAATAVGSYFGISIRPPASWEKQGRTKDPLEAIARASRIRIRRVRLVGSWWKQDGGAILAYTKEKDPIALLPKKGGGYQYYNPVIGVKQSLTPAFAQTLKTNAYTFYPPFPDGKVRAIALVKFALRGRLGDILVLVSAGVLATLAGMVT